MGPVNDHSALRTADTLTDRRPACAGNVYMAHVTVNASCVAASRSERVLGDHLRVMRRAPLRQMTRVRPATDDSCRHIAVTASSGRDATWQRHPFFV
jgi:hypothetical protein